MDGGGRVHDRAILDILDGLQPVSVETTVWRVTRKGRDPLRGAVANGRWNAIGEFEVLYTSLERDGAIAEVGYRLSLEPIWPSLIEHEIHTLSVKTERSLRFESLDELQNLGIDVSRYESFQYNQSQAIAAAARFLEFDALLVPSARFKCSNLVLFLDRALALPQLVNTEDVSWESWRTTRR